MAAVGGLYSIEEKFKQVGISARCDAAREDFTSILVRSRDSSAPLIALRDEVYKTAITHGLATVKWVPFSSTGFHPWNRSRAGISPSNVTQKLVDFHAAGVSTTEMLRAASAQRVPGTYGDAHEATNQLVIREADGQLAPVADKSLEQFALTCNHTVQAIRSAMAELACDRKAIAPTGFISKAILEEKDKTFTQLFTQGMPFLQFNHVVEEEFPGIISLIIDSDNIPNAIARDDNTPTLLLKCHLMAKVLSQDPDFKDITDEQFWEEVQVRVQRTELNRKNDVPHCITYCKDWSGGLQDPFILREVDAYAKCLADIRDIDATMLTKLAKVDMGPACGAFVRGALLKVGLNSGEKPLSSQDLAFISTKKNRDVLLATDKHMQTARSLVADAKAGADNVDIGRIIDTLDVRLVKHALKRCKEFDSMKEICNLFVEEIKTLGIALETPSEWRLDPKKANTGVPAQRGRKRGILELTRDGPNFLATQAQLEEKGCKVGCVCTHSLSALRYKVTKIDASGVYVEGLDDKKLYEQGMFTLILPFTGIFVDFGKFAAPAEEDGLLSLNVHYKQNDWNHR